MSRLLAAAGPAGERPDAVLALSDVCATGVLAELRERGIDVPGEIAVAGFDDIPLAADLAPGLTTARMPLLRMGAEAVGLALSRQEDGPSEPVRTLRLPVEPTLRASTGTP